MTLYRNEAKARMVALRLENKDNKFRVVVPYQNCFKIMTKEELDRQQEQEANYKKVVEKLAERGIIDVAPIESSSP